MSTRPRRSTLYLPCANPGAEQDIRVMVAAKVASNGLLIPRVSTLAQFLEAISLVEA